MITDAEVKKTIADASATKDDTRSLERSAMFHVLMNGNELLDQRERLDNVEEALRDAVSIFLELSYTEDNISAYGRAVCRHTAYSMEKIYERDAEAAQMFASQTFRRFLENSGVTEAMVRNAT